MLKLIGKQPDTEASQVIYEALISEESLEMTDSQPIDNTAALFKSEILKLKASVGANLF